MKILALDLGTHCGIAHNLDGSDDVKAYTKHLATADEITQWGKHRLTRRGDPRIERFAAQLDLFKNPDIVIFEDVEFATYTKQTQLWASFRTVVWLAFKRSLIECVPVATLKQFATGHGGATKDMMRAAFNRRFPGLLKKDVDDNAVDALWLWVWAKTNLARYERK